MLKKSKLKKIPKYFSSSSLALEIINKVISDTSVSDIDKCKIAKAHFSLFQNPHLSTPKARMHLNSCIFILESIKKLHLSTKKLLSISYFKRAEFFELEKAYSSAILDYKKAMDIASISKPLTNKSIRLFAECSLAIANIHLKSTTINNTYVPSECIFYAEMAVKYILKIKFESEKMFTNLAYAFRTLGIATSERNPIEAFEHFNLALKITYKFKCYQITNYLGEIFNYFSAILIKNADNCKFKRGTNYEYAGIICKVFSETLNNLSYLEIDLDLITEIITNITTKVQYSVPIDVMINICDVLIYIIQYIDFYTQLNNKKNIESSKKPKLVIIHDSKDTSNSKKKNEYMDSIMLLIHHIFSLMKYIYNTHNKSAKLFLHLENNDISLYNDVILFLTSPRCQVYSFPGKQ